MSSQTFIFVALYPEAKPLIQAMSLKQLDQPGALRQFVSEDRSILLTVMGIGSVAAAYAVGAVLANVDQREHCQLYLYGSAAAASSVTPKLYLGLALTNQDSGRDFYPDSVGRDLIEPCRILTSSRIWNGEEDQTAGRNAVMRETEDAIHRGCNPKELALPTLHDMESAAVYEAASQVLGPDQIHILKFVSDMGSDVKSMTKDRMVELSAGHVETCLTFIQGMNEPVSENGKDVKGLLRDLSQGLLASVTMENEIRQLIQYGMLIGYDFQKRIKELEQEGIFPAKEKRFGLKVLSQLREDVIAYKEDAISNGMVNSAARCGQDRSQESHPVDRRSQESHPVDKRSQESHLVDKESPGTHPVNKRPVIYIEEELLGSNEVEEILSQKRKQNPIIIPIHHYKDVFNRRRQDAIRQHEDSILVLASKKGQLIYHGAPVCQDFGNEYFYYTSCIMNCLYNCDYCYLKGMYPSGIPVIFVNLEDTFRELEALLTLHPVYLSVSYDTDLLAVESLTGYVKRWVEFTRSHPDLTIEIRTKCPRKDLFSKIEACDRVIFAYTISPDPIIQRFEHGTGSLAARLAAVKAAMEQGFSLRLCFDPMVYISDWKSVYHTMMDEVEEAIDLSRIRDFSVGSFRISESYLKPMRRLMQDSAVVQFPFERKNGYYQYPSALMEEMEEDLLGQIENRVDHPKIFRWS
jgi:spore photoproduct lyase